jgi:hypothetical protein
VEHILAPLSGTERLKHAAVAVDRSLITDRAPAATEWFANAWQQG